MSFKEAVSHTAHTPDLSCLLLVVVDTSCLSTTVDDYDLVKKLIGKYRRLSTIHPLRETDSKTLNK
jgi:hypothetical protein